MKNTFILVLLCCLHCSYIFSQNFIFRGNNLFGLEYFTLDSTENATKLLFYDLDGDSDLDVITFGLKSADFSGELSYDKFKYFIAIQENIGDRQHPLFAPRKPFMDNFPFPNGPFYSVIGDLNQDHKPDFIVSSGVDFLLNLQTLYYERKSLTGNDQFNIIETDVWDLEAFKAGSFFVPELADMDMDDDLDLLMSGFIVRRDTAGEDVQIPIFLYAKNTGTKSQPKFLGWYENPYGLATSINQTQMSIVGDIDNDNDNDILSLTTVDTFKVFSYIENKHLPNGKPQFQQGIVTPFGLPVAGQDENLLPPSLVDIDGDGDLDLFMVQKLINKGEGIGFYENELCTETLDNTINQTGSTIIANLSGVKYQWYDCTSAADIAGATAQSFQPIKSGKYAVKLDNNKGCENISECYNFIISATQDQIISDQITIYPNPTDDYFTIINNTGSAITSIMILNTSGVLIKAVKSSQSDRISISGIPTGNYVIEISSGSWKISKKLSISRF